MDPARATVNNNNNHQRPIFGCNTNRHGNTATSNCRTSFNFISAFGLFILIISATFSLYQSRGNASMVAFILFAFLDLSGLYFCLSRYEKLDSEHATAEEKTKLKIAIWLLATSLNFAFAWKVAAVMPRLLAVVIWAMAIMVAAGGFYGFFVNQEKGEDGSHNSAVGAKEDEVVKFVDKPT